MSLDHKYRYVTALKWGEVGELQYHDSLEDLIVNILTEKRNVRYFGTHYVSECISTEEELVEYLNNINSRYITITLNAVIPVSRGYDFRSVKTTLSEPFTSVLRVFERKGYLIPPRSKFLREADKQCLQGISHLVKVKRSLPSHVQDNFLEHNEPYIEWLLWSANLNWKHVETKLKESGVIK